MARISAFIPPTFWLALACLLGLTVAAAPSGCLQDDPNHCANQDGDASCANAGGFCSICVSKAGGCVAAAPSPSCHRPRTNGSDPDSTSSGSSGDVTDGGTSSAICADEGRDASCPDETPYCLAGECSVCKDGNSCAELGQPPACHPGSGLCLQCVDDSDCSSPPSSCGDEYACVACTAHADCPQSACDLRNGTCLDTSNIFWVDASECDPVGDPSADPGFGTEADPYCWLPTAIDNIGEGQAGVIHLLASTEVIEQEARVNEHSGRIVALLGHDQPRLGNVGTALVVDRESVLFVEGITLEGNTEQAARARFFSHLWLTDVEVVNNMVAVTAENARVTLQRTLVANNQTDAIVADNSTIALRSSVVVNNGVEGQDVTALRAVGDSTLDVSYSTLALNLGQDGAASVTCSTTVAGRIRNSVIVTSQGPSFDCPNVHVVHSVLDDQPQDFEDITVLDTYNSAWFVDIVAHDVSIRDAQNSPFADVARWKLGDPLREFSAQRRLAHPGLAEFAGADQP